MDAVTVPAPRAPRSEVTSLVPLRPLPMFIGDDVTPTVRPVALKEETMIDHTAEARRHLMLAAFADGAWGACLLNEELENDRAADARRSLADADEVTAITLAAVIESACASAQAWRRSVEELRTLKRRYETRALGHYALTLSDERCVALRAEGTEDAMSDAEDIGRELYTASDAPNVAAFIEARLGECATARAA